MGSTVNNATSEGHKDVAFDSKDMAKTKAGQKKEYFVKFKEKTAKQKFSEWFHEHKKKILIILGAIVLAAALVFAAFKIIPIITKPKEKTPTEWEEEIGTKEDEIIQYLDDMENSDSNISRNFTIKKLTQIKNSHF